MRTPRTELLAGSISVGAGDLILYGLPGLLSVGVSRMLAGWAVRSNRTAQALHRVQRRAIVLAIAVTLILPVLTIRGVPVLIAFFPLNALAWGGLFALTAVLLGRYACRQRLDR